MGGRATDALAVSRGVGLALVLTAVDPSLAAGAPVERRAAVAGRWIGAQHRLTLGPGGDSESQLRTGLGLGLGLAGALSLGLGVGLLVQHRRGYARFEAAPDNAGFVAALTASEVGSGLVGSGLGHAAAALGEGLGLGDRGRWTQLVIGGGLALIGTAWYAREWPQVQRDLYEGGSRADGGHDAGAVHRETAAAAVLGAGLGLAAGAGVALLTRLLRGSRARRTAARWGMVGNRGGLGLGGQF
jgi:hypothetical protein